MNEEHESYPSHAEKQIAKPVRTFETLLKLYEEGHRNFSGSDLRGATIDFVDSNIEIIDFRDIILQGSNLKAIRLRQYSSNLKVDLAGSNLSECNLQGANLSKCRLDQCNFTDSDFRGVDLSDSSCRGSDFIRTRFNGLCYTSIDFSASDFSGADLRSTGISGTFSYVNFCDANFQKASFTHFRSHGADFSNANLLEIEFPTPTTVSFEYSYYNCQTKFSDDFDPISRKMELITNDSSEND
jgi:uncharacterized protein YjbI with pentapeptide repeats